MNYLILSHVLRIKKCPTHTCPKYYSSQKYKPNEPPVSLKHSDSRLYAIIGDAFGMEWIKSMNRQLGDKESNNTKKYDTL